MKIVYLVSKIINCDERESKIPLRVFESETDASNYASDLEKELSNPVEFDEEIWNEVELEFYNLTLDDPNFENNEEYSYPNNIENYYKRQDEIYKLEFKTYTEILMNKFPDSTKEDLEIRLSKQFDYLDNQYEDIEICIDKIEYYEVCNNR